METYSQISSRNPERFLEATYGTALFPKLSKHAINSSFLETIQLSVVADFRLVVVETCFVVKVCILDVSVVVVLVSEVYTVVSGSKLVFCWESAGCCTVDTFCCCSMTSVRMVLAIVPSGDVSF